MRQSKNQNPSSPSNDPLGPGTDISAANYVDRAKAFIALRGEGFVIRALDGADGALRTRQPATEPQWRAWMEYWDQKGVKFAYSRARGLATVPCEWPEDFDAEARSSDRGARLWRKPPPDEYEHQRVVVGFSGLGAAAAKAMAHMDVSNLRDSAPKPTRWRDMTPQAASDRLNDPAFLERMRSPLPITPELATGRQVADSDDEISF